MKYETFLNLLKTYKKAEETNHKWYEFGIDLHEGKYPIAPYLYDLMAAGFETTYNEDGLHWIDWFIFDNEYGNKVGGDGFGAHDKDGTPIAYSYESLWELLEKDYKLKNTVTQRATTQDKDEMISALIDELEGTTKTDHTFRLIEKARDLIYKNKNK